MKYCYLSVISKNGPDMLLKDNKRVSMEINLKKERVEEKQEKLLILQRCYMSVILKLGLTCCFINRSKGGAE